MTTYLGVLGLDNEIRTVSDSNGYPVKGTGTNGEMNVVVTGSNVPDAQAMPVKELKVNNMIGTKASSVLITAGATVTVIAAQDVSSYNFLYAQIRPGSLTAYEVYNVAARADNSGNISSTLVHTGATASNIAIAPYRPGSPYCGLAVKNTMVSDQTLVEAYLCGLKG
jgi:hypothetical protein